MGALPDRIAERLSGRRSWWALLLAVLLAGLAFAMGAPSSTSAPVSLPKSADSAQVRELLKTFPSGDLSQGVAVVTRRDGAALTGQDLSAISSMRERMLAVDRGEATKNAPPAGPTVVPAPDRKAAIAFVPFDSSVTGFPLVDAVKEVRETAKNVLPQGLRVELTGGPGFGADIANSFAGADLRLILITALVVAVLLLITYRSPILWLVPLIVVALADRVASIVSGRVVEALGLVSDGSTSGITSVLVFGAGTNYALLLVSRYREELHRETDHRAALRTAVRHAGPAVLASNLTVVLALGALLFAVLPSNRVLGLSSAVGLLVALVFVMLMLPPALALFGRKLFWPFVPKVSDGHDEQQGAWHRVASAVSAKPWLYGGVGVLVLVLCSLGLINVKVGLSQTEQFRVTAESVDGARTIGEHYPAGEANPTRVVARTAAAGPVQEILKGVDGVRSVRPAGTSSDGLTSWSVVLAAPPGTDAATGTIRAVRDALRAVPDAQALVGGADAEALDQADGASRDLKVVAPLILLVVFVVLIALLRAVVAPLLLMASTVLSALAAIGAGSWISDHIAGFPALDDGVPLFAFLFLVALGVDYTIFLVTRAREENVTHDTRESMVRAVSATGAVITSAGVVLAAVFAVLGVLPLIVLTQLGIVVGLGILLDTFLVRTVVIPALWSLVGAKVWWPSALG